MTLTEYLQNAVTELRGMAARRTDYALNWPDDAQRAQDLREFAKGYDALADHVETLLACRQQALVDLKMCRPEREEWFSGEAHAYAAAQKAAARLVSAITGKAIPEGAM